MAVGDVELYHLDPPLHGYSVVAAAQTLWALRAQFIGDPTPPDDPVSTSVFGVAGGESADVDWHILLYRADGRNVVRTFAEAGYRLLGKANPTSHGA